MNDDNTPSDVDIYRGDPPLSRTSSLHSNATSSSSSSSAASFTGGRIGAIAAVLELAISRWARGRGRGTSTDSSSSSSSSSRSSIITLSRSQRLRSRRRRSVATIHSLQSERDFAAHISLLKARKESRQVPRNFTLYLPPSLSSSTDTSFCVTTTTSLSRLLPQLDTAFKKVKVHRNHHHQRMPKGHAKRPMRPQDYMPPSPATTSLPGPTQLRTTKRKAWYLDIASPTWEDMRTLGKILHLHPLTLEDILQRDPREKLELFPKLGYYFISFRAIEAGPRTKMERKEGAEALDDSASEVGIIGEGNIYLVVFKEGICSFHFTNISEHTDRVRSRIKLLQEAINMSSDWIAHGILDSVVDSFFPLLEEIEREVAAIEDLVLTAVGGTSYPGAQQHEPASACMSRGQQDEWELKPIPAHEDLQTPLELEKHSTSSLDVRFRPPQLTASLVFRRIKRAVSKQWHKLWVRDAQPSSRQVTLRRMARTRRLVTSLTRLLATKSEVVAQIRKRLMGLNGPPRDDDLDIAMYMGDVQDHILTLQHSLAHYEHMLSQSHPTYLSQLRTGVALTKRGTDMSVLYLTTVSLAVVCIQTLIGTMSINVKIPTNPHTPQGSYHVFGIVVALSIFILCAYLYTVRCWWKQAKAKKGRGSAL